MLSEPITSIATNTCKRNTEHRAFQWRRRVTYRSSENDIKVVGLRRGWEALTHLNLEDPNSRRRYVMTLDRDNTRTIDRRGGTVLHSSRTNPAKMAKLPDHLASKDFPSQSSKGVATNTWDVSKQVLANLSVLGTAFGDVRNRP